MKTPPTKFKSFEQLKSYLESFQMFSPKQLDRIIEATSSPCLGIALVTCELRCKIPLSSTEINDLYQGLEWR